MSDHDPALDDFLRKLSEPYLLPEDKALTVQFSARDLCDGALSVNKPQICVVNHPHDKVVVEVLVMVNALALKLGGKAVQKANQTKIDLSYQIKEPVGESAISVMLWKLTYTFDCLPGGQFFDFEFTGEES